MRGKSGDAEKRKCPLSNENDNVVYILLKCNDKQMWGENLLGNK